MTVEIEKWRKVMLNVADAIADSWQPFYVCPRCSAVVADPALHNREHTMSMMGM